MQNSIDIRCGQCRRKLAEGTYVRLSIKCPRCRALNHLSAQSPTPHASERPISTKDVHDTLQTPAHP